MEGGGGGLLRHGKARDGMKEAEVVKESVDYPWEVEENRNVAAEETVNLWRLSRHITAGASQKVIGIAEEGQGWAAWQKHRCKQGQGVGRNVGS